MVHPFGRPLCLVEWGHQSLSYLLEAWASALTGDIPAPSEAAGSGSSGISKAGPLGGERRWRPSQTARLKTHSEMVARDSGKCFPPLCLDNSFAL